MDADENDTGKTKEGGDGKIIVTMMEEGMGRGRR